MTLSSADVLFLLLGACMVLAMQAGFACLEVGTVRSKNQVNALVKIITDFAASTLAYFTVGYAVAYGAGLRAPSVMTSTISPARWSCMASAAG